MIHTMKDLAEGFPAEAKLQQELNALHEWSENDLVPTMKIAGVKRVVLEVSESGGIFITTDKDEK